MPETTFSNESYYIEPQSWKKIKITELNKNNEICDLCGNYRDKNEIREILKGNKLYDVIQYHFRSLANSTIADAPMLRICERCFNDNYRFIFPYSYNPHFIFYHLPEEKAWHNKLYFGIELEIEDKQNIKWNTVIGNLPEFVYCKSDSSLRNGFEIVSHPATFNWLKQHKIQWDKVLNLRTQGFTSLETNTCGMHIHLSKSAFNSCHLYKFMRFIFRNKSFIRYISQRNSAKELEQWASLKETSNISAKRAKYKGNLSCNRHIGINLLRDTSIEIRIFKGTLIPDFFWKNIEFCKALYDFTFNTSLQDSCRLSLFRKFVKNNCKEFMHLNWFMNLPNNITFSEREYNNELSLL